MKQTIAGFLIGLVFLMPIALAETSAQAQARSMSVLDLRLKQVGEAFSDFAFKVKIALTFDNEAKLELLKGRNEELRARQQSWVETKQEAMASFNSNMTTRQKQSIIGILQAEHEAIIEDRIELTEDIREIQAEAKTEGDAELEADAEAAAEESEAQDISIFANIGLNVKVNGESDASIKSKNRIESEAEAKAVVRKKLGFEATEAKTVVQGSTTFFVVSGTETEVESDFTMTKEFEVWVDSETGMIISVDMDTHMESRSEAEAETETSTSGSASASSSAKSSGKLKLDIFG